MNKMSKANLTLSILGFSFVTVFSALPWIPIYHYNYALQNRDGSISFYEAWFTPYQNYGDQVHEPYRFIIFASVYLLVLALLTFCVLPLCLDNHKIRVARRVLLIVTPILMGLFLLCGIVPRAW